MAYEFFQRLKSRYLLSDHLDDAVKKGSSDPSKDRTVSPCGHTEGLNMTDQGWSALEGVTADDLTLNPDNLDVIKRFLLEAVTLLFRHLETSSQRSNKVLDFNKPHVLQEIMGHCLGLEDKGHDLEQILSDCKETLKYCVKTGHPRFLNQLSTGTDVLGILGEWLTAVSNTNMFTYEVAPVFTLIESQLLTHMLGFVGWTDGEGIFSPGGALSNLYGVMCARHYKFPNIKELGVYNIPQMKIFTSNQSHYSIRRAAAILGLGTNNVVYIKCDERGRMMCSDLKEKIKRTISEGSIPLMVNATCGTTVLGAFDPVNQIADICEEHDIWLHVDGAWGGTVLLSAKHRYLLSGIQRANSMTWNPHKMMVVPLQCSAFLIRKKGLLQRMNGMQASYLFQKDKCYDLQYDTGDKTIQCGRHNDVFKLWIMWRAKGDEGFEKQINRNYELALYLLSKLRTAPHFKLLLHEIEGPNVCFWYIPDKIACIQDEAEKQKLLHEVAPKLKTAMMHKGTLMLTYQPLEELPNFFRVAVSNPSLRYSDLDFVVSEIEALAKELDL